MLVASIDTEINQVETEITKTENTLGELKDKLRRLKHKKSDGLNIRWRDEIRSCLINDQGEFHLSSHQNIIRCIEHKNSITADRNIKNKIITSLSLMYRERVIGRYLYKDKFGKETYLFGYKDLFSDKENTVVKSNFKKLIDEWAERMKKG